MFTGKYGQPEAPAFSEISVSDSQIKVDTYTSDADANATLFDSFTIVKKSGSTDLKKTIQNSKLYPTYATDRINATIDNIVRVNAVDLTGRVYPLSFDRQSIDVSGLTEGVYLVQVVTDEKTITQRIVKTSN